MMRGCPAFSPKPEILKPFCCQGAVLRPFVLIADRKSARSEILCGGCCAGRAVLILTFTAIATSSVIIIIALVIITVTMTVMATKFKATSD